MAKYVVSLGGNALGNNPSEQKQALIKVAEAITGLIMDGHEVIFKMLYITLLKKTILTNLS